MNQKAFLEIIASIFIILFLYTGISKLMDFSTFKEQIAASPLLSSISYSLAVLLPIVEIIVAILLFIPKWRLPGLYASLSLMLIFTVYIIGILNFSQKLPCSCGGVLELLSWKDHLIFNCLLIVLAILGIRIANKILPLTSQEQSAH